MNPKPIKWLVDLKQQSGRFGELGLLVHKLQGVHIYEPKIICLIKWLVDLK